MARSKKKVKKPKISINMLRMQTTMVRLLCVGSSSAIADGRERVKNVSIPIMELLLNAGFHE